MKRLMLMAVALFLLSTLPLVGCAKKEAPTPAFKIELKGATPVARDHVSTTGFWKFAELIPVKSKGAITVKYIGGPEAIPATELGDAVGRGVVDIVFLPAQWYPKVSEGIALSITTPGIDEEYKSGFHDLMDKIYREKSNLVYLGKIQLGTKYHIYNAKKAPVRKLDDLKGLKIRSSPANAGLVKKVGAAWVDIPYAEVYTALQQGVIDGEISPDFGHRSMRFQEVTKYVIYPGWGEVDGLLLLNLDTWKRLPKDMQKVVTDVMIETQRYMLDYWVKAIKEEQQWLVQQGGMERIDLSPEEGKRYVTLGNESIWEQVISKSPTYGPQIKELWEKAKK